MHDTSNTPNREYFEWDNEVAGLALRFRPNKKPAWCVQLRRDGRTIRRSLGAADSLSLEEARFAASALIADLAGDDCHVKRINRDATVAECAELFLTHGAASWKPATARTHRYMAVRYIHPSLGELPVAAITAEEVTGWRASLSNSVETGNRALAVLSGIMRHAELLGIRPAGSNPCQGLRRRRSAFKTYRLTAKDYRRLGKSIRHIEKDQPAIAGLIRFLAFAGCRKSEARLLRWAMIDGRRAALPDSKTGPCAIWLGQSALRVIAEQPRSSDYVFADRDQPVSLSKLDTVWRGVRTNARLRGLRLHDLRHGFASIAITSGEPLRTVSGLLGHKELKTTAGYAVIDEKPVLAAAERVASYLTKAMAAKPAHGAVDDPLLADFLSQQKTMVEYALETGVDYQALRRRLETHMDAVKLKLGMEAAS
jgi:integrase